MRVEKLILLRRNGRQGSIFEDQHAHKVTSRHYGDKYFFELYNAHDGAHEGSKHCSVNHIAALACLDEVTINLKQPQAKHVFSNTSSESKIFICPRDRTQRGGNSLEDKFSQRSSSDPYHESSHR